MVPFSLAIWYHILIQYGTIFYRDMVPYSFEGSPLLKIKATHMPFQNKPFSSSKRLFFFFRGINTINTRRCVELFVTLGLRPRKANASAKHVKNCRWGVAAPWWIETSGQWGGYAQDCMWGRNHKIRKILKKGAARRTACDFTAKYRGASQARAVHATRAYINRG